MGNTKGKFVMVGVYISRGDYIGACYYFRFNQLDTQQQMDMYLWMYIS